MKRVGKSLVPARVESPDPPRPDQIGVMRLPNRAAALAIANNRRINNRATDVAPSSGQCEVSIAAYGNNVVAAWNDGEGFQTSSSTQGFAYSTDGGVT